MSRTLIRRPFAGRIRSFDLRIGEIEALERACNCGIFGIVMRMAQHQAYAADIRETIRLGLIGGGETDADATRAIMAEIDGRPLAEHLPLAAEIVKSVIDGLPQPEEGDGAGKAAAEEPTPAASPPGDGTAS